MAPVMAVAAVVAVVSASCGCVPTPGPGPAPVDGPAPRPVPDARPESPPAAPATAYPTTVTPAGHLATDVGCAADTSAAALDAFFRERIGPVLGHDYQHVYPLGGDRYLWLFQDTFIDHTGRATSFDQTSFAHNTAMVQRGRCFTSLTRGTLKAPTSFEPGTGEQILSRWFWPLGGELVGGYLHVFWAEMAKTADPSPPDGLGWVPVRTWLATYDAGTLARVSFQPAPASGVEPIYGFAVASDAEFTYLFGNSFDQNLARQGGYHACPCSATRMYLARVPKGALAAPPEFRTADGWSTDPAAAVPIVDRYHAENPMQPRFLDGRWVSVTKIDGYWGEELAIDVAPAPWGPWTTTTRRVLSPRGSDPLMNTYHAHLMPWTAGGASSSARRRTPATCRVTPGIGPTATGRSCSPSRCLRRRPRARGRSSPRSSPWRPPSRWPSPRPRPHCRPSRSRRSRRRPCPSPSRRRRRPPHPRPRRSPRRPRPHRESPRRNGRYKSASRSRSAATSAVRRSVATTVAVSASSAART